MAKKVKKRAAKKKVAVRKKVATKKIKAKGKNALASAYDIFCRTERKFIAKNKTKEETVAIIAKHPHPTDVQQTQSN